MGEYFSLDLDFSNIRFTETSDYKDPATNATSEETFTITRKSGGAAFKLGWQQYRKRLVLDFSLGAGVKYREVEHIGRKGPYEGSRDPFDFFRERRIEQKGFAFILPVSVQVGYRF